MTGKARAKATPRTITLTLTEGEADFVLGLTGLVSGDTQSSPRKYAERLRKILVPTLGYDFEETDAYAHGVGDVDFRDYGDVAGHFEHTAAAMVVSDHLYPGLISQEEGTALILASIMMDHGMTAEEAVAALLPLALLVEG